METLLRASGGTRDGGADGETRDAADVNVEVHDTILDLLLAGDWAAARRRAGELGPALQERGFRADGLKVVAGKSWRRKREPQGAER